MPYFKVNASSVNPFYHPDDEYFSDVIFQNNKKFTVVTPIFPLEILVIECENKPRDMPVFGIFWLETH